MASDRIKNSLSPILCTFTQIPVLLNLYGSFERLEKAFGMPIEKMAEKTAGLKAEKLRFCSASEYTVLRDINSLPLMKYYKNDSCGSVSMGCVISEEAGVFNSGIYRVEPMPDGRALIHCRPESGLFASVKAGKKISIAVGCSPFLVYASVCQFAPGADELLIASALGTEFIKTEYNPVPSDTQVVIHGRLTGELAQGGSFFNYTGTYSSPGAVPVMEVDAVLLAEGGYYQSSVTGIMPMESAFLGIAAARMQFYRVKRLYPEIVGIDFTPEGVFWRNCNIKCTDNSENIFKILKKDYFFGRFSGLYLSDV